MKQDLRQWTLKLVLGILLLGACVEALAVYSGLPNIAGIWSGFKTLWRAGTLQHDVEVSMARWFLGWLIGGSIGVVLGLLTGRKKRVRIATEGLLVLCRAIPFISLVPLSLRVFGLAETGKVFLVAWASTGVCWVVVHKAALEIPQPLVWRANSLGASWRKWTFRVLIPSCSGGIHSGLRASLSLGLIVIAVAEMSGVYERSSGYWWSEGLGYRLFRSLDQSRDDLMMASIFTFALLGIAVDQTFILLWGSLERFSFRLRQRQIAKLGALMRPLEQREKVGWQESPWLEVSELRAAYDSNNIIDGLSFKIPPGETMSVVGPSGCGKTTLIRAIGHFIDDTFSVSGRVIAGRAFTSRAGPWVGVVLQDAPVFENLTVWDNLTFGNRFRHMQSGGLVRGAWRLLSEFGLEPFATQRAGTLSGGQRQRLALAMVLANRPFVLLLDEPFGALDAITRRRLQRFYWQHVHGKVTAVFVTHDLEEALLIGDTVRVGVAADARVINIDKRGIPPHEWELREDFSQLRSNLISALEESVTATLVRT